MRNKLKFFASFILLLYVLPVYSIVYYSQGTSDPTNKNNWNISRTGGTGNNKPSNFTSNDTFVIQNGHTMTPTTAWTVSGNKAFIQIENGGKLVTGAFTTTTTYMSILTGGIDTVSLGGTLTISNGVLSISGTLDHKGTITLTSSTAIVNNGGTYQYNQNGGSIMTATWSTGSTCEIRGVTSTAPSNLGQTFYNYTWNCGSQSSTGLNLGGSFSRSIKGNFTIQSTGNDTLYLTNGSANIDTIHGDFIVSSGAFLSLALGTGSPYIILKGNFTINGTLTKNVSGTGSPTICFANSGTTTFTNTGTISNAINFVDSTGTLNMGTNLLTGTGKFTMLSGATINIGHAGGITSSGASGNIQVSGTRTFSISGNYVYNGSASQAFGNGLPSIVNNITINNGNTDMQLPGALTVSGTLTISSGRITIGNNKLTLSGNFSGSSSNSLKGNGTSSQLTIDGSGVIGTLYFDQSTSGVTNRFKDLTINRNLQTITLGNTLEITGTVTPTSGILASRGNLKLISNSSGTALIAAGTGSYITGNVTVQRYIPVVARRFRFLSSPITNGTLEDWRNEMYITGNNLPSADQSNTLGNLNWGFDATSSNSPSVYWYDETVTIGNQNSGWAAIKNSTSSLSNQPLTVGKGYRVYVRGDRSNVGRLTGADNTQNAVTLDLQGSVNTGNISIPVSYTSSGKASYDGWCLIGNPYPCPFNWNALHDAGRSVSSGNYSGTNYARINPTAYIFNASTNTYNSYNALSDVYIGTGFTTGVIPSGAAFFVQTSAASPSLTFTETYKSAAITEALFKTSNDNTLSIALIGDSLSSDNIVIKLMSEATSFKDDYDIVKLTNPELNIYSYGSDSVPLAANVRPFADGDDHIPLGVKVKDAGMYKLSFKGISSFSSSKSFLLKDNYLNRIQSVYENMEYPFSVFTGDSLSQGEMRFELLHSDSLLSTGIFEDSGAETTKLYLAPNMADEITYIYSQGNHTDHMDISLTDLSGKTIHTLSNVTINSSQPLLLTVSDLKPGIYFIHIYSGVNQTLKLIKK